MTDKKPATRIYLVEAVTHERKRLTETAPRLIEASSQAAAIQYACRDLYTARVADVKDVLAHPGIVVETAGGSQ